MLDAHRRVLERFPDALLVLVPRHPQRFEAVRDLLAKRHDALANRSVRQRTIPPATSVLLGDTMGELMMFYAAADVAFVAGSLVPIGGHNLLEPASVGRPVLTGPHNFNGEEIAQLLMDAGAACIVDGHRAARARGRGAARRRRAARASWARPAGPCSTRIAARSIAC